MKTPTVLSLLREAARGLEGGGLPTARQDPEWLLAHLLGVERWALYLEPGRSVPSEVAERFASLLARRRRGEPLQHLLGWEEFYGLRLRVTREALIPRSETELLVEWALEILRGSAIPERRGLVIELGAGSGAIACALAWALPLLSVVGVEISAGALAVARQNVRDLGLNGRVRLVRGDLFGPLAYTRQSRGPGAPGGNPGLEPESAEGVNAWARGYPGADLVIANPPYIPTGRLETLPVEVRGYEPREALDGGPDGMRFHRRILTEAPHHLRPGGWLLMEAGEGQAGALTRVLAATQDFEGVEVRRDLQGKDRMIGAQRR